MSETIDALAVEDSLQKIAYWNGQRAEATAHGQALIDKATGWMKEQEHMIDGKLEYHNSVCRAYLEESGRKSIKLVHGTVSKRAGSASVVITDDAQLDAWAREQGKHDTFFRVKVTPDKRAIHDYIKEGGEQPLGVDYVVGDDSYKVVTNG